MSRICQTRRTGDVLASACRALSAIVALAALASVGAATSSAGESHLSPAGKPAAPLRLQGKAALRQAKRAGIDIGGVIEMVSHRFQPAEERSGPLVSQDRLYRAELDASGVSLTLRRKLTARQLAARRRAWRAGQPRESKGGPGAFPAKAIPFQRTPAFVIRTSRVSLGDTGVKLSMHPWRTSRSSAARVIAPALSEHVTAREGHLEWDFVLKHAPASGRTMTIEARILTLSAATRVRGAHPAWRFAVGAGRSVRVGAFRVEDARGRPLYRALPAMAGSRLALRVPSRVLRRADYPLTIDPIVSPEYPTSDPVVGSPSGDQTASAVAFDGSNYLVVWQDERAGSADDIYGTRISQAGVVLDPVGIPISTAAHHQTEPALAFDGTNYLVVWADERLTEGQWDIYGARVSKAGAVLDPGGIAIATGWNEVFRPAVAFDGTNYLVAWDDNSDGISGARVSQAGVVLDPQGLTISTAVALQWGAEIAFDGTNYLVVWQDSRSGHYDIYGARVSPSGQVLDPTGIAISTAANDQYWPTVAFDGMNYLVVWGDAGSGSFRVYGARISPAGNVLDPTGILVSPSGGPGGIRPDLAFDGTNYLVVWEAITSPRDIYGARVSPSGLVLDPGGIPISTAVNEQWAPRVAFDGTNYFVTWQDNRTQGTDFDIFGARVSPAGTVVDPSGTRISTAANNQHNAAVAFDGTNYLVVWEDDRATLGSLYCARVTQAGLALDGSGIAIGAFAQGSPAVAFDGTNYLVAWADGVGIDVARVSTGGTVLDPGGIAIAPTSEGASDPAVAFDGTDYLVAWTDLRTGIDADVYGARVSPTGTVLDPEGVAISSAGSDQISPAVAFDGTNYLVAWTDYRNGSDVYGARVSPTGTVLDPEGVAISTAANDQSSPALAFDGVNYLVAWVDMRSGNDSDVYGARVSPSGTVLDPGGIAISAAANDQTSPALAFAGSDYLVAWADSRTGVHSAVYGARVSPSGSVLDPAGFAISATNTDAGPPATVAGTAGRTAVAYERIALEPTYAGARRIFLRLVDLGSSPPPPPDTTPPETTITSGPSGTIDSTSATFEFTASEPSTFECSLDSAAFSACESPKAYTGLGDGPHTFRVRAIDAAGNTDPTPAQRTWTVDTTPPETTITSGPPGTTHSTSATFEFTASEPSTSECSLDAALFAACSSPMTYSGLGLGSHTFRVRATDAAGNTDPTPAQRTWTVQANQPPVARFGFSCTALTCGVDGSASTDSDGTIQSYSWTFGDGTGGSGVTATHGYAQAVSYTVTLTVTDNDGATGSVSKTVTLINLTAQVTKLLGSKKVALSWSGPDGTSFDVYRNGGKIATVQAKNYTDTLTKKGTYTYKVCATAVSVCSNTASVTF